MYFDYVFKYKKFIPIENTTHEAFFNFCDSDVGVQGSGEIIQNDIIVCLRNA